MLRGIQAERDPLQLKDRARISTGVRLQKGYFLEKLTILKILFCFDISVETYDKSNIEYRFEFWALKAFQ